MIIFLPKFSPEDHREYFTTVHQVAQDSDSQDFLAISPRNLTLTTQASRHDGGAQYQTIFTEILSTYGSGGQLEVKRVRVSNPDVKEQDSSADPFAYAAMPGAILNYEVLTRREEEPLCLYIYELSRLRCFGQ
ncbi:hypothetical protein KBJ94_27840 [Pseudomonas sp. ITA]|uniref:hypothetical protein n=1 Tax=Pseudomonas sp. ITA TaxID=2825841 RepID=UPI002498562C|nr:hypothetical protein [Pseudomonas sp. ITA]MDI2145861.1 hypothetical protein [Pseudomonas sp. ITA]